MNKTNPGDYYYQIPAFIAASSIPAAAKLLYAYLLFASQKGTKGVWTGQEKMGKFIGLAERQTRGLISVLEACGLVITTHRGKRITNIYKVVPPDECDRQKIAYHRKWSDRQKNADGDGQKNADPIIIDKTEKKIEEKEKGKGKISPTSKSQEETREEKKNDLPHEQEPSGYVSGFSSPSSAATAAAHPPLSVVPPSREDYIREMGEIWSAICGPDGIHILNADLESNSKRVTTWADQLKYWDKRLSDYAPNNLADIAQTEAWKLIARYLKHYRTANGAYPKMQTFLNGWYANSWKDEEVRIRAFCKTHNADPVFDNYIEAKAIESRDIPAKWLMSSGDYQKWFNHSPADDDDDTGDSWENRPSAGAKSYEELERKREEAMAKEAKDRKTKIALDLIARARVLIKSHQDDEPFIRRIVEAMTNYREGILSLDGFRSEVEILESGNCPVSQ